MLANDTRYLFWGKLGEDVALVATVAARSAKKALRRRRRRGAYTSLHPGAHTPLWNACAQMLSEELKPRGSKVRLARYLGVPKQRITDFVTNRSRMPDAETLLKMLDWMARKQAGEDLSL